MYPITIWSASVQEKINNCSIVVGKQHLNFAFNVYNTGDSLWVVAEWPAGSKVAFRTAFTPNDDLSVLDITENGNDLLFNLGSAAGKFTVNLQFPDQHNPVLRYTTHLTPEIPMFIPFWPRDILPLTAIGEIQNTAGTIHAEQVGTRSGNLFFSLTKPITGSVFYFQNLTALADYCEDTKTSAGGLVGGQWPELGFTLPATESDPLLAGKGYVISDAFVHFTTQIPTDQVQMMKQFLNSTALIYLLIPRPVTKYHNWLTTVEKGLNDLSNHKGCWAYGGGNSFLNAYVADYKTPAEIMVQLAVLLPLIEYQNWKGKPHRVYKEMNAGFALFYDKKMKTISRWLPVMEDNLDKSEEQKEERVMDSWYLHHPLVNLARLAQMKDKNAEKLLMDSIDYAIKVARHFNYQWPCVL